MNRLRWSRISGCASFILLAATIAFAPSDSAGDAQAGVVEPDGDATVMPIQPLTAYHVRILRARRETAAVGSALFGTDEVIVPLSEEEMWGRTDQAEAVREALGAPAVEALPGLVVRSGPARDGGPHRFRTSLGETTVEITFYAEEQPAGWHRVHVSASESSASDLLDATLRIRGGATTALAAPLPGDQETLVLGITPLPLHLASPARTNIHYIDGSVIPPNRIVRADPIYPETARKAGLEGKVVIELVVRSDGRPDRPVVLAMPEGGEWFAGSTVEAVMKWRWEPALKDGRPVDVYMTVVVQFALGKKDED